MSRLALAIVWTFAACASMSRGELAPASPAQAAGADGSVAGAPGAAGEGGASGTPTATAPTATAAGGSTGLGAADLGAEADFGAARSLYDRGDREGARAALEAFVARHPEHPSRPAAEVMLGRLALLRGDPAAARKWLAARGAAPPDSANAAARYVLGLAELRLGNFARARELLLPFLPPGMPDPPASDDAAIELRGALAEATGPSDPTAALELWEGYFRVAREPERAFARRRATELAGRLSPEGAWRAFGAAPPAGLTRAVLGAKAALYLRGKGDSAGAGFVDGESNAARHALGFDVAAARVGPGDPTRLGLAIPLSGKFQVVGEAALRAAMLAGGAPSGTQGAVVAGASQLVVRDTATDADRAARGMAELTRGEAVIGIVSAQNVKTSAAAIAQATEDGIAVLALEDAAPGATTTAFQMIHAPEMRATALAREALKLGARRFAILGPDNASGKRLREAFRRAAVEGGGTIAAEASYVAGATSFAGPIASLKKASAAIDAIFVPDTAERLPLIAPALAVADLWPQPWAASHAAAAAVGGAAPKPGAKPGRPGDKSTARPRPILLLSTANDLSRKLLDSAGRYVQGALLCPGFFADESDPTARIFVEAYRGAYAREPHATEAYAYDAVATLRAVVGQGARTRGEVVKALGAVGAPVLRGLTGDVTFGPDHGRADSPRVYVVAGDDIHRLR